jgi:hypothetical protein
MRFVHEESLGFAATVATGAPFDAGGAWAKPFGVSFRRA